MADSGTGSGNGAFADELDLALDGLVGRRLVLGATAPLQRLPWALRALLFSGGLVALTLVAGHLLAEPRAFREIDLWAGLLLLVSLIAYERLAALVKRTARTALIPVLSADAIQKVRAGRLANFLLTQQTAVCAAVGLLTAALLALALHVFFGQKGPATLPFLAVGSAIVCSQVYIPASISLLSLMSMAGRVELFALDPNRSLFVGGLRRLGQSTVVASAALGTVGALGPLLLPGLGAVAYVLAALVLCGGVAASVAQFFVQQYALGALLARVRNESVAALQKEIAPLFARRTQLSADERDTLTSLLSLYDRVVTISSKVFTPREALRFASPLLVPASTMLLTSLHLAAPVQRVLDVVIRQILKH